MYIRMRQGEITKFIKLFIDPSFKKNKSIDKYSYYKNGKPYYIYFQASDSEVIIETEKEPIYIDFSIL